MRSDRWPVEASVQLPRRVVGAWSLVAHSMDKRSKNEWLRPLVRLSDSETLLNFENF